MAKKIIIGSTEVVVPLKSEISQQIKDEAQLPSLVFDTQANLEAWILDGSTEHDGYLPSTLAVGQNLYTIPNDEPDFWVKSIPVVSMSNLEIIGSEIEGVIPSLPYAEKGIPENDDEFYLYDGSTKKIKYRDLVNGKPLVLSINKFPRLEGETNDYDRIIRALDTLNSGDTLFFPNGTYEIGNNITLDKSINLLGENHASFNIGNDEFSNGVILIDTKFIIESSNFFIKNISLYGDVDNGFQANTTSVSNIFIDHCSARVNSHGFVFESYEGEVKDIYVTHCNSYLSTHGFVSKALNVTFEKCNAHNHSSFGFAIISDNGPDANKKGFGHYNNVIDCYAQNSDRGLTAYCRDMHSTNNTNNMTLVGLYVDNFNSNNNNYPLLIGDIVGSEEHSRLNVSSFRVYNFNERNTTGGYSIYLGYAINGMIIYPIVSKGISYSSNTSRVQIIEAHNGVINPKNRTIQTLQTGTNFPTIDSCMNTMFFITSNTSSREYRGILGGLTGVEITIYINDVHTSLKANDGNLVMTQAFLFGVGSWVRFKYDGSNWQQMAIYDSTVVEAKLDKVSTVTTEGQVYGKNGDGSQTMFNFGSVPLSGRIAQRNGNSILRQRADTHANRPTTNLGNGDTFFNTTQQQFQTYIGDTNHWLYQKYGEGDTLPTPSSGQIHQYMVVLDEVSGTTDVYIGGEIAYGSSTPTNGSMVFVRNISGTISIANSANMAFQTVSYLDIEDSGNMKLMRVA